MFEFWVVFLFAVFSLSQLVTSASPRWKIFHVTDVHGWIFGHPHNATLDADFGDLASLLEHMNAQAAANGDIFLLYDTGDLIEGTGLSDATPIHGEYIFPIVKMVKDYNGLTAGNHDIGHPNTVQFMTQGFISFWNGTYMTANTFYKPTNNYLGTVAYSTFQVQNYKILNLGYIFNFTQNAENTVVVDVSTSLTQKYFSDAMNISDVDIVITLNHINPQVPPELNQIYSAIRAAKPHLPIIMLSGHRHVEYFQWYDKNAFTIESGKYFEEIGYLDFYLESNMFRDFSYQWVPTSVKNFQALSKTDDSNFLTQRGKQIKAKIAYYFNKLDLNYTYGCAPRTFSPYAPLTDQSSLYKLWLNTVIPAEVYTPTVSNSLYFCNTATLRANLFQGRVTKNDIFEIMPFRDQYFYFPPINGTALQVLFQTEEIRTNFYLPQRSIDPSQLYHLVVSDYDKIEMGLLLNQMFPNQKWGSSPYPTKFNGDSALGTWISKNWPMSPTCSN